jgi:hypothetical protein
VVPPTVPPVSPPAAVRLTAVGAGDGGGPRVRVFNPDGSVRFDFFAFEESFRGGVTVATGDVTGDGVDDIVAGAGVGGGPRIRVFDGTTGAEVGNFFAYDAALRGGVHLAVADLDADGKAEIVTGAGVGGGPHVRVFTAAGQVVREWFAYDPDQRGGVTVAVGDTDGDGRMEVVTGPGSGHTPEVRVFDARTGNQTRAMMAYAPGFTGGVFVAAGDLDGDGRAEVVTGPGAGGGPHVRVFDARTGAERAGMMAYDAGFAGGVRVAAGPGELLVGPGAGGGQTVKRFRGLPPAEAGTVEGFEAGFTGGVFVG